MRNTDLVNYIGFSTGGNGFTGVKVRYATDVTRRTKTLVKMGATDITFFPLPKAMSKIDAVQYLATLKTAEVMNTAAQEAITRATSRLAPNTSKKANTSSSEDTE
jgi:hypothetical protein